MNFKFSNYNNINDTCINFTQIIVVVVVVDDDDDDDDARDGDGK